MSLTFKILFGVISLIAALLLIAAGYFIIDELTSDKIHIRKDSWACTESHTELMAQSAGKTTTLVPITVCDNWHRVR